MKKVAVVYWSGTGNTEGMANLVADGVKKAGGEADVVAVGDFSADKIGDYDAIALGSPAMGDEVIEEDEMQPFYDSAKASLSGKLVGLFGSYDWGEGKWIADWAEDVKGAGANLIADPVKSCGEAEGEAADACVALGEALAK